MSDDDQQDKFTLHDGDLHLTRPGKGPTLAELLERGWSFNTIDGQVVYRDADGNVVDPDQE